MTPLTIHSGESLHVIIDHREARSPAAMALSKLPNVTIRVEHMAVGDYLVDQRILFERKTLPDLFNSIKDGRLFCQASRLASSPCQSVLILEGTSGVLRGSAMRREAVQGAIVSITLSFGIPVLRSMDPEESARLMLYASKQGNRQALRAFTRKGKRPRGSRRMRLHILQGFPGIGPARAENLLRDLGTIRNIANAAENILANVPGIGLKTAKRIRGLVESDSGES